MSAWGNSFGPSGGSGTEIIYVDSLSGSITSTALSVDHTAAVLEATETITALSYSMLDETLIADITVPLFAGEITIPVLTAALTSETLSVSISEAHL